MIIVGAKGFAKEVLEIFYQKDDMDSLAFFDNRNSDLPDYLYGKIPVLRSEEDVRIFFSKHGNKFTLGLGGPARRSTMCCFFEKLGGELVSIISPLAQIGHFGTKHGDGCSIMSGAVISNGVTIGKGSLIYFNCIVAHDSQLGMFVELSPGAKIAGNCTIGDFCQIGTNATILPNVKLGKNVVVGAGAVVTKDVSDNTLVTGIPAVVKRILYPIN